MRFLNLALPLVAFFLTANAHVAMAEATHESEEQLDVLNALAEDEPDDFAGLSVDHTKRHAVIRYVTGRDENRIRGHLAKREKGFGKKHWSVTLKPVKYSHRQLEAVKKNVTQMQPWADAAKPVLAAWYVDVERNVVQVGVTEISPQLRRLARETFGDAVELKVVGREEFLSRWEEYPPFRGGIHLRQWSPDFGGTYRNCTSGFMVWNFANKYPGMLTAAHCFSPYAGTVFNPGSGELVGPALVSAHWNTWLNPIDMTVLSMNTRYARSVIGGDINSNFSYETIYGSTRVRVGDVLCTGGAVTGGYCSFRVDAVDVCLDILTCGLIQGHQIGGAPSPQPGDSGGPLSRMITYTDVWYRNYDTGEIRSRVETGVVPLGIIRSRDANNPATIFVTPTRYLPDPWEVVCKKIAPYPEVFDTIVGCRTATRIK